MPLQQLFYPGEIVWHICQLVKFDDIILASVLFRPSFWARRWRCVMIMQIIPTVASTLILFVLLQKQFSMVAPFFSSEKDQRT